MSGGGGEGEGLRVFVYMRGFVEFEVWEEWEVLQFGRGFKFGREAGDGWSEGWSRDISPPLFVIHSLVSLFLSKQKLATCVSYSC